MAGPAVWAPYCGIAPDPGGWLVRWNGDPVVIGLILLAAVVIARAAGGGRWRPQEIAGTPGS